MLKKLSKTCPTCGSRIVNISFAYENQETARYECGCQISYIPNGEEFRTDQFCEKDCQLIRCEALISISVGAQIDKKLDQDFLFSNLDFKTNFNERFYDSPHRKLVQFLENGYFQKILKKKEFNL